MTLDCQKSKQSRVILFLFVLLSALPGGFLFSKDIVELIDNNYLVC